MRRYWFWVLPDNPRPPPPTLAEIVAEVAALHGVTVEELMSPSRETRLVLARWEAMWRMSQVYWGHKSLPRYSSQQIGRFFGRDHSTVLHGVRKYREILQRRAA